jgi:hypothetical protein
MRFPRFLLLALLCFSSLLPRTLFAQGRLDALQILEVLQTRCESGITYDGYVAALDEAQSQLESFFNSKESERNPEFSEKIERALIAYQSAFVIWKSKLEYKQDFIRSDHPTIRTMFSVYPEAESLFSQNGQTSARNLISFLWDKADDRIAEAKKMITAKRKG